MARYILNYSSIHPTYFFSNATIIQYMSNPCPWTFRPRIRLMKLPMSPLSLKADLPVGVPYRFNSSYGYIRVSSHILRKIVKNCINPGMRITQAMYGSTEGSISVSHTQFDICSSLALIHEKHANTVDLFLLRNKVSKVIFKKLWSW